MREHAFGRMRAQVCTLHTKMHPFGLARTRASGRRGTSCRALHGARHSASPRTPAWGRSPSHRGAVLCAGACARACARVRAYHSRDERREGNRPEIQPVDFSRRTPPRRGARALCSRSSGDGGGRRWRRLLRPGAVIAGRAIGHRARMRGVSVPARKCADTSAAAPKRENTSVGRRNGRALLQAHARCGAWRAHGVTRPFTCISDLNAS